MIGMSIQLRIHKTQPNIYLYIILTFRSHHEIFIRRSWYSVFPSLDYMQEGHRAMNRDEGSYLLSHAYNRFPDATADLRILGRTEYQLLLMKIS